MSCHLSQSPRVASSKRNSLASASPLLKADDPSIIALTEILKAAEKGAALTNQLLAFSRKQGIEYQLLDLKPILIEDEQMLRHLVGKNFELMTELEPSLGLVSANASCMHQVLMNLAVLFEPFFTTKQGTQGSGLGLSTVSGIVRERAVDTSSWSQS